MGVILDIMVMVRAIRKMRTALWTRPRPRSKLSITTTILT
jgi:hypothetical protein